MRAEGRVAAWAEWGGVSGCGQQQSGAVQQSKQSAAGAVRSRVSSSLGSAQARRVPVRRGTNSLLSPAQGEAAEQASGQS